MEITQINVAKLYLATFGRPLDTEGLEYWTNTGAFADGSGTSITTMAGLAASFAVQDEFTTSYPSTMTTTEFVTAIYNNLLDREPDAEGLAYWVNNIDTGVDSKDSFILIFINGAQDSEDGNDASLVANRAEIALELATTTTLTAAESKDASVTAIVNSITGDSTTTAVTAAKASVKVAAVDLKIAADDGSDAEALAALEAELVTAEATADSAEAAVVVEENTIALEEAVQAETDAQAALDADDGSDAVATAQLALALAIAADAANAAEAEVQTATATQAEADTTLADILAVEAGYADAAEQAAAEAEASDVAAYDAAVIEYNTAVTTAADSKALADAATDVSTVELANTALELANTAAADALIVVEKAAIVTTTAAETDSTTDDETAATNATAATEAAAAADLAVDAATDAVAAAEVIAAEASDVAAYDAAVVEYNTAVTTAADSKALADAATDVSTVELANTALELANTAAADALIVVEKAAIVTTTAAETDSTTDDETAATNATAATEAAAAADLAVVAATDAVAAAESLVKAEFTSDTTVTAQDEDIAIGTEVKTVTTNEEGVTYTLDNANFAISAEGVITTAAALDYETMALEVITVTATDTDGNTSTQELTLELNNLTATYALAADAETAIDGDTVNFTFTVTNPAESELTEVTYTISGLDSADVVGGDKALTGTATVDANGVATVSVTMLADSANSEGKTITATVNDGTTDYTATTTVVNGGTTTSTTVTANELAALDGAMMQLDTGDATVASYDIQSNDNDGTTFAAKVNIAGSAITNITAGSGDDTIIASGTGNNVINAGEGKDKIFAGSGSDVIVIEDGAFKGGSIIDGDGGVNTIRVSGTNDLSEAHEVVAADNVDTTIDNIQYIIIEDGAVVTIDEKLLSNLTYFTVNGTTAELTIVADNDGLVVDTIDMTNLELGSIALLTVSANVSIQLTAAQITAMVAIDNSGQIITDQAGIDALLLKGVTPAVDSGSVTLLEAATQDLSDTDYSVYEMDMTAEQAADAVYITDSITQQQLDNNTTGDTNTGDTSGTATVNITDTATVAQAIVIKASANVIGTNYAVADTAANIAAGIAGAWLDENDLSSITFTDTLTAAQAKAIFVTSSALTDAVAAAAVSDEDTLVLELPTYAIEDNAADFVTTLGGTGNVTVTDVTKDATSVTITSGAFKAEDAQDIKNALTTKLAGYDLSDSATNLAAATNLLLNGATNITATAGTVEEVEAIAAATNSGTTTYAITDTAENLANADSALLAGADEAITISPATITVEELTAIADYLPATATFTLADTPAATTTTAALALIEEFAATGTVTVVPLTALTLAQHTAIAATSPDTFTTFDITDTTENLLAANTVVDVLDALGNVSDNTLNAAGDTVTAVQAIVQAAGTLTVSDATTIANITTIDTDLNGGTLVYSIEDSAANVEDDITVDNETTPTSYTSSLYVEDATTVSLLDDATVNEAIQIELASDTRVTNTDSAISYTISDTYTNIEADKTEDALDNATSVTAVVDSADNTIENADAIAVISDDRVDAGKSAIAYSIEDNYTNLNAITTIKGVALDLVDTPDDDAADDAIVAAQIAFLEDATSFTAVDTAENIRLLQALDVYDYVDATNPYAIEVAATGLTADIAGSGSVTDSIYVAASTVTITGTVTVENAGLAFAKVDAISASSNAIVAVVSDTSDELLASDMTSDEIAALGVSASVTVTGGSNITVAQATAIAELVPNGDLVIEEAITDEIANILTLDAATLTSLKAGTGTIVVTDTPNVEQMEALIDMLDTATLLTRDGSDVITNFSTIVPNMNATLPIEDSLALVQNASTDLLSVLAENTHDMNLTAGSNVSLTVAQAYATTFAALVDDGDVDATYVIVDTIDNIVNAINAENTNGGTIGTVLSTADSIIAEAGSTISGDYAAHLATLNANNLDLVNSDYSISSAFGDLDNTNSAVTNATTVTITDTDGLSYANALTAYGYNTTGTTITNGIDSAAHTNIFTIASGVATYTSTQEAVVNAAGKIIDLEDDALTVEEAGAIATLLGDTATLTYNLTDTAAALAAADASVLANATTIVVNTGAKLTVEQLDSILAGATHADFDFAADITYVLEDTAANLAAASQDYYTNANNAVTLIAGEVATIEQATTIETKEALGDAQGIAINVNDTATAVTAGIADAYTAGLDADGDVAGTDTITLTTTATAAEATVLGTGTTYANDIDTHADVADSGTGVAEMIMSDTAANILAQGVDFTETTSIIVTDAVSVSKAAQIVANGTVGVTAMTFDIVDEELYIADQLQASAAMNNMFEQAVKGTSTITTTDGISITLDDVQNGGTTFYVAGTVAYLNTLSEEMLATGYIVNDTVANLTDAANDTLVNATDAQALFITDTGANILAGDATLVGTTASEVHVNDTVNADDYEAILAMATTKLYSVANVEDTAANLADIALGAMDLSANDGVTAITVEDSTVTVAQVSAIVTAGATAAGANVVFDLSDTESVATGDGAIVTGLTTVANANSVVVENLTDEVGIEVVEAGLVYAANSNVTQSIIDTAANIDAIITDGADEDQVSAINAATVVALADGETVSVELAVALESVTGFDGTYTINDTVENILAADASILSGAVEVQVTNTEVATVAQAIELSAITNLETETVSGASYLAFDIEDSAANISAADATILDNVFDIEFTTDENVTAAQALAYAALDSNTAIKGLTVADTIDVVDTYVNITNAANATGVQAATTIEVTDTMTIDQANAVSTASGLTDDITMTLTDTLSNLKDGIDADADDVTAVSVTDAEVNLTFAATVNGIFGDDITTFEGNVTATKATLVANNGNGITYLDQATTVTISGTDTDLLISDYTALDGTGFLDVAGDKLIGGYDIVDSVDNIYNAAINNEYSNAVVANAATVSLDSSNTMTAADAAVISLLNFTDDYKIADTATTVATLTAATVNGALTTTITMENAVEENFNAALYSSDATIIFDVSANTIAATDAVTANGGMFIDLADNVDTLTLDATQTYTINTGLTTIAYNQVALDVTLTTDDIATLGTSNSADEFAIYHGYTAAGGFIVDDTLVEASLLVYANYVDGINDTQSAIIIDGTAPVLAVDNFVISSAADDTIDLATLTTVDTVVLASTAAMNGVDTITGFTLSNDYINVDAMTTEAVLSADVAVANAALADTITAGEVYLVTSVVADQADTDADAAAAINAAGIWTDASAGEKAYFFVADDNSTSIYEYTAIDTAEVQEAELTLVGSVDGILTATEIVFA